MIVSLTILSAIWSLYILIIIGLIAFMIGTQSTSAGGQLLLVLLYGWLYALPITGVLLVAAGAEYIMTK